MSVTNVGHIFHSLITQRSDKIESSAFKVSILAILTAWRNTAELNLTKTLYPVKRNTQFGANVRRSEECSIINYLKWQPFVATTIDNHLFQNTV